MVMAKINQKIEKQDINQIRKNRWYVKKLGNIEKRTGYVWWNEMCNESVRVKTEAKNT